MEDKYNVLVTQKRFLKKNITLKGNIISENVVIEEDGMGFENKELHVLIKLENGKTIKITDDGINFFNRYSYEKIII